jgi:hypothetical protein
MSNESPRHSGAPKVILSLAIAAAIVIAAVACAIYFVAVRGPLALAHGAKEETFDSAQRISNGFKTAFNFTPEITVNGVTEVEQANSVMELATASQEVVEHYSWSQTWFGSTKKMELDGVFHAKAGFDLHKACRISLEGGRITATLPEPKLLSLELDPTGFKIPRDENGWWNKITSADREKAIAGMQEEARAKAAQSGILEEAKGRLKEQLSDLVKAQNIATPVDITFQNDPLPSPTPQR